MVQRHTVEQTDRQTDEHPDSQTDKSTDRGQTTREQEKLTRSFISVELKSEIWNYQIYRFLWLLRLNENRTLVCRV